ncbi:MAG: Ig-like domain-containing protein [Bacteroidales bacterium]|nr:Ig-like domain-containing protein [Bacteroidales bacterium]
MMTTDTRTTRRGRSWQMLLLLALLAWLVPQGAQATHVDDTWKYQVALNGANTVRIQVPVYDQEGADCWVSDGNLKVVVNGEEKNCFHWCRNGDTDSDSEDIYIHFSTGVGGSFDITQGNSGNHFTMTQSGYYQNLVYRNSDGNTYTVYAVWRVPYEYLGKTLKFTWDVERDGNSRSKEKVSGLSDVEIAMPDAPEVIHPQVTMASMSYSVAGKMELPWFIATKKISALRYEYVDAYGITVWNDIPTKENNGTIYLDATVPHDNFCVVASYKDTNDDEINNVSSMVQNLTIIHAPVGLTATQIGDAKAKVRLDWHVRYPSADDLATSDYFEVQRSLTGQEADFVTIGTVPVVINDKDPHFAYTDSTIVNALVAEHLTGGSSLPNLTYRVRRMITQTWGWDGNPCAQRVEAPLSGIHLQRLKSYSAKWADERAYTVRVDWDYVDEPNAVWDSRAKLMMVVTMRNKAGEQVDTKTYELTDEERSARTKTIDLSRTCVKYDIRMYVDPGTSPLRSWDLPDAMRITSAADWDAFCQRVKDAKGQYDVNAVLCADITTSNYCGADDATYRGTFDGNGHTLTFNKQNYNQQYVGPFYSVGDATIRNLHTAGTITSSQKFVGGITAWSNGNTIIENCRSSVNIGSTVNGDATNGGIVAACGGGQLTIVDCLFDGSLTGSNSHSIGGFVGWSNGKVTIVNSHFNPSKVEIKYDGCRNWARMSNNSNLTVTNSYYTTSIEQSTDDFFVIRSKDDWTAFKNAVKNGSDKDINVLLNTDLSLTTEDIIGRAGPTSGWNYHGTFDGNGHTLSLDFSEEVSYNIGLFYSVARNTTIRNLRVTGKVYGKDNVSALVGGCGEGANLNIDHVYVSADVSAADAHVGGFVGNSNYDSKVSITDCLYDGKLYTHKNNPQGAACFMIGDKSKDKRGLQDWHQTRVYERSSCETKTTNYYGMNVWWGYSGSKPGWRRWSDTDVCLSSHDFQEVPEDCRNITNQDSVIVRMNASKPGQWEKDGSGNAVPIISMTGARLLAALGPCWQLSGGKVTPRTATVSVNPSALPDFYHEGTGRIDKVARAETRQSSVVLTWTTEDGVLDYFEVYRRVKGTTEWGEPIATGIDRMGYEDTTVSPLLKYEYKVVAVTDCEGLHTSETDVVEGFCKNTGRVSGYVRMNDGTAVAGIEVEIAPSDSPEGGATVTVTTDDKGYFVADELSYYGQQSITYNVTPVARDNIKLERGTMPVEFNSKSNDETLPDFIITSGHRFSGYVMYEGTSIPVKGAHFRVDGNDVHNAAGELLETAFDGSFSFRVLGGNRRIQAVMDGHTFTNGGYYKGEGGHYFTDNVAQIYFYDATKVRLAGRVVGGDDQGRLPLENNLSRNNLGDDLTMVFTLEGDNTSWLVYDNLNPTLAERNDSVMHSGGKHKTKYTVQRKRMTVKPDPVTGEYELLLPPVRWKVSQIYCKGYPTLFQDGQVSEVVDLTGCLAERDSIFEGYYTDVDEQTIYCPHETANARYSRIYHAPVEITYRQLNYDSFEYFGDRNYYATSLDGTKAEVPLVAKGMIVGYEVDDNATHKPQLTATVGDGNYSALFDGDLSTAWQGDKVPAYVEFKTDYPVSVKDYTLTTAGNATDKSAWNPKTWTLKARAHDMDAWTIISAIEDGKTGKANNSPCTYDVSSTDFYQYFRLDITHAQEEGDDKNVQLAELSFTCSGKGKANPIYDDNFHYTFDYPVFSIDRKYPIEISVGERYIYNNDTRVGKVDRVNVGGGTVNIHNGMKNGLEQETVPLDDDGKGIFYLMAEAKPRLLTGEDALHTVTMTLTQDGTTYEAEPLRGYVLNLFATGEGKDVLASDKPLLIDILRDPPGSGSSATLSKGSTLKLAYEVDMQFKGGLTLGFGTGTGTDTYSGTIAVDAETGTINTTSFTNGISLDVIFSGAGKKAYSYTMNVGEDITTSSAPNMVGADADLYIGVVENTVVMPMSTIRAIPDAMYRKMLGHEGGSVIGSIDKSDSIEVESKYGSMVEIARGTGADGNLYHLVRDVSLGYGPELKSQFVHSQKYITTELLPKLAQEIRDLLFTGTRDEAVALVNKTGKAVYWSNVAEGHKDFGTIGAYEMIKPAGKTGLQDEILEKYNNMVCWIEMIMSNEREKLWAYDKLANYEVDGGGTVTHSETFESEYSQSQYISYPFTTADYFENDGQGRWDRLAASAGALLSQPALASCLNALIGVINMRKATNNNGAQPGQQGQDGQNNNQNNNNNAKEARIEFWGQKWSFSIKPVAEYSSIGTYGSQNNYSRKESFNLVMDSKSHLSVDVFRVFTEATDTTTTKSTKWLDVYHNANFNEWLDIVKDHVKDGVSYEGISYSKSIYPHSFIYRTRGGATANPWENARYTIAYHPGMLLDERTKKIENPKITADRQSVSGVPYGETARFTIYLTNDSEDPEAGGRSLTTYSLYVSDSSNPYGAKITCDGKALDGSGRSVILMPGEVVTKVIEVTGGNSFDLEGLTIGIASEQDWRQIYDELTLDVHYLHQAGPVNISLPGDKWVMNTYAQYDNDRGWYMPVIIDGFDRHQHNFDHIEFQYKETLRGDDAWTNLCSYYADEELMKAASGEREMIPENGNIEAHFYGEGTVMEKAYDLRAVLYCRNGNSFLTTSSPIVSGVKDTRRPQLFGTPEPKDGILRLGGNIIFNFSEDIEYNYLNAITNFEVKGEVNNDNVTDAVSVQFTGEGSVESEAQRNFSGKDLTIDLMVRPDKTGRDMPLFSHGTNGKRLQLWLTADYHLKAIIDDQTFLSTDTIVKSGFTQVAMSIVAPSGAEGGALTFYNGGKQLGSFKMTEPYNGTGRLIFGRTNETNRSKSQYYEGRMMEARVWYRAMTGGQVGTTYGSKRLTGYEMGLVDYYPMNEGTGDYALDKTQGANAQLMGASWAMPRGWSLSLDNDGVALTQQALARTAEQDYTMMFWFKTADADGTLVSNGSGEKDEAGAENHFWLGFDDGTLAFRSNGMTVEAGSGYNDNQWHHYAMTVNRARGVANIYIDQALKATFSPDSLGGISGGTPVIGGCVPGVTDNTAIASARTALAEPMAATGNTVDLSTLTSNYEAKDGDVLTGTLGANVKISVADGATVTLNDVTINGTSNNAYKWAGVTCPGDATIILEGTNSVKGFYGDYPGIHVAEGKTLTIKGDGSLNASSNGYATGIGGGWIRDCGNIIIESGTIIATGGHGSAGIGSGTKSCGNITITGGNITATGGNIGAGIGNAYSDTNGLYGSCGKITITGGTITATGGEYGAGIGGHGGSCGEITISGGTITATGGFHAAGIGSYRGSCGDITITDGVYQLTAIKGEYAINSIGVGLNNSVGTVTIGGTVGVISESPYTYTPTRGVTLNKTTTTLPIGSSETLTATVIPDNATYKSVTWTTSNANVATVTDGTVTAVAPGTATITVTTGSGAKTATCEVTVIRLTTGVSLNKVNTTLVVGSTETLTATVYPPNATDKSVTWTTSNADVATVADGTVTGVGPGIATITATSSNGQTATCEVTVIQHVTGVSLNKTSMTMTMGSTETLTATIAPANASDKSVTWTTSNANVAMVADGVVTAVAPGTATITVTTNDGAKTATCTVTVTIEGLVSDMTGNVDELCMFQQALPLTLIKAYATKSPQGDEAGLLTYLAFDRQERQKDNDIVTVAYPWSKKIYLDDRGEVRYELDPVTKQATTTPLRDYVFVGSADEILRHITNETAAPVVPYEELTNLKFSFAGKDNQVLVELDELASRINRRNIYVTLRDVEDKNGNAMVSPQTACYYVNNSSLRWQNERQTWLASYGYEDYIYFDILNNSATSHTYTIENCPRWLDMEAYTGIIGPLGTVTIKGVVNKSLNVGTYDEIIYLTDEDGVAEPLYLNLTVTTSAPEWSWSVDEDLLKYSMNIAGQVILNGEVDIDSRDIVGVFDRENRCHGIAHVNYSALTGESDLFLTVYDSSKKGTELYFKIWQYSTGREMVLTADGKESMTFRNDTIVGVDTPVRFEGGSLYVQTFDLKEGWNWVSFNVASEKLFNLNTLLGGLPWENGDVLTEMSGNVTMTYKNGTWLATGDVKKLRISPRKGYAIKVAQDIQFPVGGSIIKSEDTRTITVSNGWNGIGYTPILNLSVETALSDYYDNATPGDIIKSHSEFAYFTKTGGTGRWRGNLQYMKPGEGYMLLRKAEGEASFRYPFYEPGSTFLDAWAVAGSRSAAEDGSADVPSASTDVNGNDATVPAASPLDAHRYRHTMSLTAVIEGFEPEEGDLLVAYADGEQRGFTTTVLSGSAAEESEPLYLNIGGEKQADLWFAIERNGDIVASTGNVLTFRVDDVVGSPDEPFALRFAASATGIDTLNADQELGKWYTVNGIELPQRPTRKGVYIYNGNKVVIK